MALKADPAFIRVNGFRPDPAALKTLPEAAAREHLVLPLWLEAYQLVAACADVSDERNLREVQVICRRPVRALQTGYLELQEAISRYYHDAPPQPDPDRPGLIDGLYLLGYLDDHQVDRLQSAVGLTAGDGIAEAQASKKLGLVEPAALAETLGLIYKLPHLEAGGPEPFPELAALLPVDVVLQRGALPLWWLDGTLVVGLSGAEALECLDGLDQIVGTSIQPVVCPEDLWDRYYRRLYLSTATRPASLEEEAVRWLLSRDHLTELDVTAARAAAHQGGRTIEAVLIENHLVDTTDWLRAISQVSGIPLESRSDRVAPVEALANAGVRLPVEIARRLMFAPMYLNDDNLVLALTRPNPQTVQLVERITGRKVTPRLVGPERLKALQDRLENESRLNQLQFLPPLGDMLVKLGVITAGQLKNVSADDEQPAQSVGKRLIETDFLNDHELATFLSFQTGLPAIRMDHARFESHVIDQIPASLAKEHRMLPLWAGENELWLVVADPLDSQGLAAAEKASGKRVHPIIAPETTIQAALDRLIGLDEQRPASPAALEIINQLSERGYLTQIEATEALRRYVAESLPLDEAILSAASLSDDALRDALSSLLSLPVVGLELEERQTRVIDALGKPLERTIIHDPVNPNAALLIDLETARRLSALPVDFQGSRLRVAFADPLIEAAQEELQASLGRQVIPMLAARRDLDEAIQRLLGRRNLGAYLLIAGVITRSQLNDALDYARRTGVRLGNALVNRGYLTWEQLYRSLSEQADLPFYELDTVEIDEDVARRIDADTARANGILPLHEEDGRVVLATIDPLNEQALETAELVLAQPISPVLITENDLDAALERLYHQEYLHTSISELLERSPEDSAYWVLSRGQKIVLAVFLIVSAIWLVLDHISYLIVLNSIFTLFYLTFSIYKLYLIYHAMSHDLEVPVSPEEISRLYEADLPIYTVLIPVYHEASVLPDLLESVRKLDYPPTKLDIKVLLESDDVETIAAFHNWNPPSHFHGVIVPPGQPQTKPKACNYGLLHARGDYVVIFDAEDRPEADQLKKIIAAFKKSRKEVACIQSKLNYYNSDQNLLTRWFTVEYSMWFDLFLPGLDYANAPIPLGGTSNHFRRDVLVEIGAWDPYNVTEDADLGVRLYKRGYKTAIIDSTTYEEATSRVNNWIRQRSRWIKGYIQTWLVHMRHPLQLINEIGLKAFLAFQIVVGGTFFAALMNPVYWLLTTLWFLVEWELIQRIFPGAVFYLGGLCLFVGNFAFTYMNVAGAMRRRYYGMVKYALLTPLYWGLTSIAAWKGFLQLIVKPHFWEKTEHGMVKGTPGAEAEPTAPNSTA